LSENQCRAILYVIYHFSENSNRRKVGKKQEQTPQASKQNSSKKEEGNKEAIRSLKFKSGPQKTPLQALYATKAKKQEQQQLFWQEHFRHSIRTGSSIQRTL